MARLTGGACAFLFASAAAGDAQSAFRLEKLEGRAVYEQSRVWSGRFTALNGREFDASEFYESRRQEFFMDGILSYRWSARTDLIFPFFFDAGYKSRLFAAEPLLSLGFGIAHSNGRMGYYIGGRNLLKIGGTISEFPCVDDFDREFHCGTGAAWVDAVDEGKLIESDILSGFDFRVVFKF